MYSNIKWQSSTMQNCNYFCTNLIFSNQCDMESSQSKWILAINDQYVMSQQRDWKNDFKRHQDSFFSLPSLPQFPLPSPISLLFYFSLHPLSFTLSLLPLFSPILVTALAQESPRPPPGLRIL